MPEATRKLNEESEKERNKLPKRPACDTCRKRKMKCDGRRPVCGACSRSHRYAWLRSKDRANFPQLQDCLYEEDQSADAHDGVEGGPFDLKTLEESIFALEVQLKAKSEEVQRLQKMQSLLGDNRDDSSRLILHTSSSSHYSRVKTTSSGPIRDPFWALSMLEEDDDVKLISYDDDVLGLNPVQNLFRLTWPRDFPHPELLYHLVDTFFGYFPFASRILHRATFETCLALSPSSPDFPQATLIHAICAMGSIYTVHIRRPPKRNYQYPAGDFQNDLASSINAPSFAEEQVLCSKRTVKTALMRPGGSFQALQAQILITWFECANGRYPRIWMTGGNAIHLALAKNLQHARTCYVPSDLPGKQYETQFAPLEPPSNFIEEENRRNCFWLAYAADRCAALHAGWSHFLDEKCITQCLPAPEDLLFQIEEIPISERQHIHTPDIFTNHPPEQTDSFVLWTKAMILLSLVKAFHRRYIASIAPREHPIIADLDYPPASTAFQQLDGIIRSFINSFPKSHRDPLQGDALDNVLYAAHIWPYMTLILLNSPQVDPSNMDSYCAKECLNAAQNILNYIYLIRGTSFEFGHLDPWCALIFFAAAHEILRHTVHQAKKNDWSLAWQYRAELDVFIDAILRMSDRLMMAERQLEVLHKMCAEELDLLFEHAPLFQDVWSSPSSLETSVSPEATDTLLQEALNEFSATHQTDVPWGDIQPSDSLSPREPIRNSLNFAC